MFPHEKIRRKSMLKKLSSLIVIGIINYSYSSFEGYYPKSEPNFQMQTVSVFPKKYDDSRDLLYAGGKIEDRPASEQKVRRPSKVVDCGAVFSLNRGGEGDMESLRRSSFSTSLNVIQSQPYSWGEKLKIIGKGIHVGLLGGIVDSYYTWQKLGEWSEEERIQQLIRVFGYAAVGGVSSYMVIPSMRLSGSREMEDILFEESLKWKWWRLGYLDGRKKVSKALEFPWRTYGELEMEYANEDGSLFGVYSGSGTLIGNQHVLTAAHNFYDRCTRTVSDRVTFYPGKQGNNAPKIISGEEIIVHKQYIDAQTSEQAKEYDIALLKLDAPVQDWGFLAVRTETKENLGSLSITGYPGEKGSFMYTMEGSLNRISNTRMFYDIDTTPGQSGSAVCVAQNGTAPVGVVGVHAYGMGGDPGRKYNSGTHINADYLCKLGNWITI